MLKLVIPAFLLGTLLTFGVIKMASDSAPEAENENLIVLEEKIKDLEKTIPDKINQENFHKVQEIYGKIFQMLLVDLGLHLEMKKWKILQEKIPEKNDPVYPPVTCPVCPTPPPKVSGEKETSINEEKIEELNNKIQGFESINDNDWFNGNTASKSFQRSLKDSVDKAVPLSKRNKYLDQLNGTLIGKAKLNGGKSPFINIEIKSNLYFDKNVRTYWGAFKTVWLLNKLAPQTKDIFGKADYLKVDAKKKNRFFYQWDEDTVLALTFHIRRKYWYGHLFVKSKNYNGWRNRARFRSFEKQD